MTILPDSEQLLLILPSNQNYGCASLKFDFRRKLKLEIGVKYQDIEKTFNTSESGSTLSSLQPEPHESHSHTPTTPLVVL